jgi:SAM-dependent methyltransferase
LVGRPFFACQPFSVSIKLPPMNWKHLRLMPWLDTRARFVSTVPRHGALLDIGSSDGKTLGHIAELRPDLNFFSTDIQGAPEKYPPHCRFHRGDVQSQKMPWAEATLDAVTCMQLVEHLKDHRLLFAEIARLLKPGGRVFFETPHPSSLQTRSIPGSGFTLNFFDDPTHVRIVTTGEMGELAAANGLKAVASGISRNWLIAACYPAFCLLPNSHKKFTAQTHWLGWSAYLIAQKT